jgi:mono/diheme cytochrome c family protein
MRITARLVLVLLIVGALVVPSAFAQTPPGSVERGQQVYLRLLCHACHGTVGQGGERGAGPKLSPFPLPYSAWAAQIRTPRQVMPPYTATWVSDQDIADMYAYILSVKPPPAAKDLPLP